MTPAGSKYKAPTPGLEDNVYDCVAPKDGTNYSIVTEKLCNHFQATVKMGSDVALALRNLKHPVINYPDKPAKYDQDKNVLVAATAIEEHRYKREYDAASRRHMPLASSTAPRA